ncbi:hypothetical protein E2C01_035273 [Portunus trituberculatus]|uniref:Uncharacterized protein n=1 Tax=Portunus trituberculatus TaxID=210409 RepID=A0A5B7F9B9_PORTR|nr:hypothetical protein [Portunus trituberculatus]
MRCSMRACSSRSLGQRMGLAALWASSWATVGSEDTRLSDPPVWHVLGREGQLQGVLQARVRDDVVAQAVEKVHPLQYPSSALLWQTVHSNLYHFWGEVKLESRMPHCLLHMAMKARKYSVSVSSYFLSSLERVRNLDQSYLFSFLPGRAWE